MKKQKENIKKTVIKIVNSRLRVEINNDQFYDKNIQTELGATTQGFQAVISMLEKYYDIVIDDEMAENLYTINDLTDVISRKSIPELRKSMMEYN